MPRKPYMRVVVDGLGCREQYQCRFRCRISRLPDKFLSYTLPLMAEADSNVGQVRAVGEIRERTRYADQETIIPGAHNQIGVGKHSSHPVAVLYGSSFAQGGCAVNVNYRVHVQTVAPLIFNQGSKSSRN